MTSAILAIDIEQITAMAGETTFAKGVLLAKAGSVHQLTWQGNSVSARVTGSHHYQVHLHLDEKGISSNCNCPAATYQVMCKHAVATALTMLTPPKQAEPAEPAASETERLRSFFARQEKAALITLLLDELERNQRRWQHWLQRADRNHQPHSQAALIKLINAALPQKSLWEWREVANYFDAAENQFEAIWEALESLPVEAQWAVVGHALSRLNRVLQQIDDSGGYRFAIEAQLTHRMPELFRQLPWSEQQQADWLFKHLLEQPLDLFPSLADFGDAGHTPSLLALCEQALARTQASDDDREHKWRRQRYAEPLMLAARARGDWRTELTIQSRLAQSVRDWLALCQLCLDHQEPREGEFWLAKARQQANNPHERRQCDRMAIALCEQLNDKARAWALANKLFTQQPSFEEYQNLIQLQRRLGWTDAGLLQRVEEALKAALPPGELDVNTYQRDALLRFYLDQGREDDACDWVKAHKVGAEVLLMLADRVLQRRPADALTYHFRVAASTVAQTNNDAYQQAVAQLQRLEKALPADDAVKASFYQQLDALLREYKRKRNFIQLIARHFPSSSS